MLWLDICFNEYNFHIFLTKLFMYEKFYVLTCCYIKVNLQETTDLIINLQNWEARGKPSVKPS